MGNNFAGGLVLHSVPALEPVRTLPLPPGSAVRFSRDGRTLVFGSRDGRVWRLDTRTWTPRGRPLDVGDPIRGIELSHDGRLLVTASDTGSGRLWDLASGDAVGTRLSGVARPAIGAAFLRGGGRLAVMHADGGVVWDDRASASIRRACAVAGRTLTRAEWEAVLPGRGYAPACAGADRP